MKKTIPLTWAQALSLALVFIVTTACIFLKNNQINEQTKKESKIETESTVQTKPSETYVVEEYYNEIVIETTEVELIAKTVYAEARGLSKLEQSAVVWCILNRVDAGYGTILEVITAPNQFAYNINLPLQEDIVALTTDVLTRWQMEKYLIGDTGRTLPKQYLWFHGDGNHNYFRDAFSGGNRWNWACKNPYPEEKGI